jgi:hypothetical protein
MNVIDFLKFLDVYRNNVRYVMVETIGQFDLGMTLGRDVKCMDGMKSVIEKVDKMYKDALTDKIDPDTYFDKMKFILDGGLFNEVSTQRSTEKK